MNKILKVQGNKTSQWVTIPNNMSKILDIRKNDVVKIEMKGKRLIITKEVI